MPFFQSPNRLEIRQDLTSRDRWDHWEELNIDLDRGTHQLDLILADPWRCWWLMLAERIYLLDSVRPSQKTAKVCKSDDLRLQFRGCVRPC